VAETDLGDLPPGYRYLFDRLAQRSKEPDLDRPERRRLGLAVERTRRLLGWLGNPHLSYQVIHITGTNGKSSTAQVASALLRAKGVWAGTFTSPHLVDLSERVSLGGRPIEAEELSQALLAVRRAEDATGEEPGFFEILTVAACVVFSWRAVEVAVVEVGIGGRHDSTNVLDADVAVVTNVGLDHLDLLGPTRVHVAHEKSGVIKSKSLAVIGERDPELRQVLEAPPARARWWAGEDFGVVSSVPVAAGRLMGCFTPFASYEEVFLALRGGHQARNAAVALAGVEGLLGEPLGEAVVRAGFGAVSSPGRLERFFVGGRPVFVDGVKNPTGAQAASLALTEEGFGPQQRVLVVGLLAERDPKEMIAALGAEQAKRVFCCRPDTSRAMDPEILARAAAALGADAMVSSSVREAIASALRICSPGEAVAVLGSLYLAGPARSVLEEMAKEVL
jgi:dihydrofolate synthase/folylpolyglutamate synthase